MPLTLDAAIVPNWLQTLGAVQGLVDKGQAFCVERGIDESALLNAKLADDMLPLTYQLKSCAVHSQGALDGVVEGVFSPDMGALPESFADLRERIGAAQQALRDLPDDHLEGMAGNPMRFEMGDYRMDFTVEDFLFSFTQPNFYFHAATAYDILRAEGVKLGKRDFMGPLRLTGRP